jgi:hypothetical protein
MLAWILPKVRPGSIIVCHDGVPHTDHCDKPGTVHLLRRLVPVLREQGYVFVSVPELLGIPAYQEDHAPTEPTGQQHALPESLIGHESAAPRSTSVPTAHTDTKSS